MKILTVSIAAYNIEEYLEQCLVSFLDERLNETLEVLIINDGSTDSTAQIAEQYVQKNPAIFRLINKENGGHGSTINRGIKEATGKYFRPVDGDDWVDTKNLVLIIDKLSNIDSDLVLTCFNEVFIKTGEKRQNRLKFFPEEKVVAFENCYENQLLLFHNVIYKTLILKDNNISFSEKTYYEDTEYVLYPFQYIITCFYIPLVLYNYRLEREGQSVSIAGILKHKKDLQKIMINIFTFYNQNKKKSIKKMIYYKYRITASINFYYEAASSELWLSSERKNIKENQLFYKRLFLISPYLFLSYMTQNKIRILQLVTWFRFDTQIFMVQKWWQSIKRTLKKGREGKK